MVTRTDGPFEYWEVTGDAVRSAAEAPGTNADVIQSLAGELEGDEKAAADAIEGDIEAGVAANTTAAKDAAQSLAAKGQYAVGLLKQFATDVDTFDTTVNQINLDYQGQLQANISTAQTDAREKATGDEDPDPVDTGAIAASVKAGLMPRYQKAEGVIDDAADTVASMFKQGPTDANVRDLPWDFTALETSQTVKIGETKVAVFRVTNHSDKPMTGRAVFNVVPEQAGPYFEKLSCFCFTDQTIQPGQTVEFPVVYFVDPKFEQDFDAKGAHEVTLSYTFYPSSEGTGEAPLGGTAGARL